MTGNTHRAGGMLCSVVGFALLKEQGLLLPEINPCIQWLVMYPFCYWGSTASDLDHNWESCPTKDYPSWLLNKMLHITRPIDKILDKHLSEKRKKSNIFYMISHIFNAHHRSWQTHSDLTLIVMLYFVSRVLNGGYAYLGAFENAVVSLIVMGLSLGIIAHFILDLITPEGINLVICKVINTILGLFNIKLKLPEKLHLVPHSSFFATGNAWEQFINKLLKIGTVMSILYMIYCLIEPYIPYTISI